MSVTTKDLWAAIRQRDENISAFFKAIDVEEKYLHETKDTCDIMHGDIEGAFHRLRAVFYLRLSAAHNTQERG